MNRREFLKDMIAHPTNVTATSEESSSIEAPPSTPQPIVPTAGSPRQYAVGSRVLVNDARAWLCCDEIGFYAIDAVCPHLGCTIRLEDDHFVCPGHHSAFSLSGRLETGPALRDLRYLYVDLDSRGQLVIRRDRVCSPDERLIA